MPVRLSVGDCVLVKTCFEDDVNIKDNENDNDKRIGLIKYIGFIHGQQCPLKQYVGIELLESISNGHCGTIDGYQYFTTQKGHGIHVDLTKIIRKLSITEIMTKLKDVISLFKSRVSQYVEALNERDQYIEKLKIKHKHLKSVLNQTRKLTAPSHPKLKNTETITDSNSTSFTNQYSPTTRKSIDSYNNNHIKLTTTRNEPILIQILNASNSNNTVSGKQQSPILTPLTPITPATPASVVSMADTMIINSAKSNTTSTTATATNTTPNLSNSYPSSSRTTTNTNNTITSNRTTLPIISEPDNNDNNNTKGTNRDSQAIQTYDNNNNHNNNHNNNEYLDVEEDEEKRRISSNTMSSTLTEKYSDDDDSTYSSSEPSYSSYLLTDEDTFPNQINIPQALPTINQYQQQQQYVDYGDYPYTSFYDGSSATIIALNDSNSNNTKPIRTLTPPKIKTNFHQNITQSQSNVARLFDFNPCSITTTTTTTQPQSQISGLPFSRTKSAGDLTPTSNTPHIIYQQQRPQTARYEYQIANINQVNQPYYASKQSYFPMQSIKPLFVQSQTVQSVQQQSDPQCIQSPNIGQHPSVPILSPSRSAPNTAYQPILAYHSSFKSNNMNNMNNINNTNNINNMNNTSNINNMSNMNNMNNMNNTNNMKNMKNMNNTNNTNNMNNMNYMNNTNNMKNMKNMNNMNIQKSYHSNDAQYDAVQSNKKKVTFSKKTKQKKKSKSKSKKRSSKSSVYSKNSLSNSHSQKKRKSNSKKKKKTSSSFADFKRKYNEQSTHDHSQNDSMSTEWTESTYHTDAETLKSAGFVMMAQYMYDDDSL